MDSGYERSTQTAAAPTNRVDPEGLLISMTLPSADVKGKTWAPGVPATNATNAAHAIGKAPTRLVRRRGDISAPPLRGGTGADCYWTPIVAQRQFVLR